LWHAQKNEAVGRLAGGVAHDFNNLVTVISGYSDLLLMGLPKGDPLRRNAEEVKKAGDRAASLTRQLLAFSRRQVLNPQILDLNAVISNIGGMLLRLIGEDIDLLNVLHPGVWPVKADPGQIEQVLVNLAVNARDAMPGGGKVTLETANVTLGSAQGMRHEPPMPPGHYVMIAVSDTGIGMDRETQNHIFEPFFTTKEEGKGTGLGLATVYGIVKQSGGYIWIYSEAGQGTTFKVFLPRTQEAVAEALVPGAKASPKGGTETVLVAEDEIAVRSLVRSVLESSGYTVLDGDCGDAALQIARDYRGRIRLLLTDVIMPRMSGRELADRVQALDSQIRIVYMSGYTEKAIVHHGMLDADAVLLQKPFSPADLVRKVREVLDAPETALLPVA
ncbi:MAG: ATP-binding protein, partial [Terriglobia bacterium]